MARFDPADYESVEERIKRFYKDHPDGAIHTDLLSDADKLDQCVVKAYVYIGERFVSTGLAFEKAGSGGANNTAHLENAETSAIGRALANYNYSGNKRASREEMQKVGRGEEEAQKLYDANLKVLQDKKLDETITQDEYDEGVKWLNQHLKTVHAQQLVAKKLEERFAKKPPAEKPEETGGEQFAKEMQEKLGVTEPPQDIY